MVSIRFVIANMQCRILYTCMAKSYLGLVYLDEWGLVMIKSQKEM